mmetsp:Transcript_34918/g.48426  ORF Transcript_34918/g.48426 Transcript_34918/m.48426 type:complete len:349 (+) Transcript_34918:315-1361(+)|eukprot:CAMPEP_0196587198 /NCGR_PEP_ID=MMETSP1081-20130531/56726_1 /TAXON_ID=36882 /ORGANISM="Pyramimonas amylifera, Strain CCMP720" /LENGTH=348 /DNA_ID=CAMNT_0041909311 /DNA_START=165 /DNA_END=1211 /DNA_ORIENTATION=-
MFHSCLIYLICGILFVNIAADSLSASAKSGDIAILEQLLAKGDNPNILTNADEEAGLRPALWEAANNGDFAMVSLLLQFHANTSQGDNFGTTPLHLAVQKGKDQVVRILLSYGADADAPNRLGDTPRTSARSSSAGVLTLFSILEAHGPVGLEDPPGSWHLFEDKEHALPFYFNPVTQEARWMKPPSCAWKRMHVEGQPIYVNEITHQTTWILPPALCWKKISVEGTESFWLNFKTNVTTAKQPAELPEDLAQESQAKPSAYWFNVVTGTSQWNDPKEHAWNQLQDSSGRNYWFKPATGDSTYTQPQEAAWKERVSKEHGRPFYFNEVTEETTWKKPAELGWIQHDEL